MIDIQVDQNSVREVLAHMESVKLRIFAAAREGMQEGMDGLAVTVSDHLRGDPIVTRTGELNAAVLRSPRVVETPRQIAGTVSGNVGAKNVALWLEMGISVPAVVNRRPFAFLAGENVLFSYRHKAFKVLAKPFMGPSLDEYAPTILEIIRKKVTHAIVD